MGRQVRGKYVYRLVGSLVDRQVDRHARIYKASFEPAEGRLQKLVTLIHLQSKPPSHTG